MAIAIVYVDVAFGASKACKSVMGKFSCRQLELKKSIVAWQASKLSSWIDGVGVKLSVLQVALKIDFYRPLFMSWSASQAAFIVKINATFNKMSLHVPKI